jgi:hypothetical protein
MTSALLVLFVVLTTEACWRKRQSALVPQPAADIDGYRNRE